VSLRSQKAVQKLPEGYGLAHKLDLTKNIKLAIGLNLASLILFLVFGVFFFWLFSLVRPRAMFDDGLFTTGLLLSESIITRFFVIILVYLGMIILHEAVHGLFFWIYTKEKPEFGFRGVYAYAGAPSWYLTKTPYLIVGLAPLVLISVAGFIAAIFLPSAWIFPVLLFITLNASGAVGDIYAFFWILSKPAGVLVQDFGDRMKVYAPGGAMEAGEESET
jgi:hypothetical protein